MSDLEQLTHDELDALAGDLDGYPRSGNKDAKVAALEVAGASRGDVPPADLPERAVIRANVPLPELLRGEEAEVELTARVLRRAANGLVSIVSTDVADDYPRFTPSVEDPAVAARAAAGEPDGLSLVGTPPPGDDLASQGD